MVTSRLKCLICAALLGTVATADVGAAGGPVPQTAGVAVPALDAIPAPTPLIAAEVKGVLEKYCVTCHNERLKTANVVLEKKNLLDAGSDRETWERVVRKLRARAMPPAGSRRPDTATLSKVADAAAHALDHASLAAVNAGRPPIHRLNRLEYTNAIRDLLGLEIDGKTMLPADDTGFGFDNIADVLTMSPGLFERYLLAASKISRLAVADPTIRPLETTYALPYLSLGQDERMSEDLPFGSRGGVAIKHYFPLDGEYLMRVRLQRKNLVAGDPVRGLAAATQVDVRIDGERIKLFVTGGGKAAANWGTVADYPDEGFSLRFMAKAGTHAVGIALNQDVWKMEGFGVGRLPLANPVNSIGKDTSVEYGRVDAGIDSIDIAGPFNGTAPVDSAVRQKTFACTPATPKDEEPCAQKSLARLARLAYRAPIAVDSPKLKTLMTFYRQGRSTGGAFAAGMQSAIERMLVDPNFLFRIEADPPGVAPGTNYLLSDLDLASRLSFFLWSSIPDESLLSLAERGRLRAPGMLEQQVKRMLQDPKADTFIESFFGQWLTIRNVASAQPDTKVFPEFDDNLREAFTTETKLFLKSQVREDRPVTELLTANYTFVNERLARHYGISGILGSHYRRVTLPDTRRAGLLGQGSVLLVTSYNDRTSVVIRGKFVMDAILGTPPPPPPTDVPPLENTKIEGSLRQRMELHRKNPVCASCHNNIDPMGFALENFNGVGKYRTTDARTPVDPSGTLPDGSKFSGPAEFRTLLLQRQDAFLSVLTQQLMTYATGRGVELFDMPSVRKAQRDAKAANYQWTSVILGIVKSIPFQMRRAQS